jgi:RNA polymerase sigma factor (TIGR02999 family)
MDCDNLNREQYSELRKLAAQKLAQEKPGQTLEATALVHEAYLRLVAGENPPQPAATGRAWDSRGHFFAAAAEAMRRILVDRARRKRRLKHGGDLNRVDFEDLEITVGGRSNDIIALDDALTKFAREHPEKTELVKP